MRVFEILGYILQLLQQEKHIFQEFLKVSRDN